MSVFCIVISIILVSWIVRAIIASASDNSYSGGGYSGGYGGYDMDEFRVRLSDQRLNEDGTGPLVKEVQGKGLFPLRRGYNIGFVTTVFDVTDGGYEPVVSAIDAFQEENSVVFQHMVEVGRVEADQGLVNWVRLCSVIPEILQAPYSGRRDLMAMVYMVDLNRMPNIQYGFVQEDGPDVLWQQSLKFTHNFEEKGYTEASESRDEAIALAIKIGMAVGFADGSLGEEESAVLTDWIMRSIAHYSEDKQEDLKHIYNDALQESFDLAESNRLVLSDLTSRLNEIGDKTTKYEAIELCFDVMAADGVADAGELSAIKHIAAALELDPAEIDMLRDQKIVGLGTDISEHASIEELLGIDPEWSHDEIKKHLRREFQKWNNRLNTLSEGDERDNAQMMLDRIAEARKKYA